MCREAFNPAILIPVYNHAEAITIVVAKLRLYGYPILMVDDGSDIACQRVLDQLQEQYHAQVFLLRLSENRGKGAAVKAGLSWLHDHGYSHAMQIDADGQHNIEDMPTFLAKAEVEPEKLVTGYPQYDESVPKVRLYARYLTHIWIWINTLSFSIVDSMCGFRVYPVEHLVQLLEDHPCGNRMDFDSEVIVRWVWSGREVLNLPTTVRYPADGVSHFKLWLDNALITCMHTRLFFGMLWRLPVLLLRKLKRIKK